MPTDMHHIYRYCRDMGISPDDGSLGEGISPDEAYGLVFPDMAARLTDQFGMAEVHDLDRLVDFHGWVGAESPGHAGFSRAFLHHKLYDDGFHQSLFFRLSLGMLSLLARNLAGRIDGNELDRKTVDGGCHFALEWKIGDSAAGKYPQLADAACMGVNEVDLEEISSLVGRFYGKDRRRLHEQLSAIRGVDRRFFTDPSCFARSLLEAFGSNGDVKEEMFNQAYRRMAGMGEELYKTIDRFSGYLDLMSLSPEAYEFLIMPPGRSSGFSRKLAEYGVR